jgi:hypothetical protein
MVKRSVASYRIRLPSLFLPTGEWPHAALLTSVNYLLVTANPREPSQALALTHLRQFAAEDLCNSLILLARAVSDAKM